MVANTKMHMDLVGLIYFHPQFPSAGPMRVVVIMRVVLNYQSLHVHMVAGHQPYELIESEVTHPLHPRWYARRGLLLLAY